MLLSVDKGKIVMKVKSLAIANPKLASEWHPTKNEISIDSVSIGSKKKVWWLGKCGHEWEASVYNRNRGVGCPYCSGLKAIEGKNDLATIDPELAKEWHPTKNAGLLPNMVKTQSNKKVWWLGKCGHEWEAPINARWKKKNGCPYCSNHRVLPGFNDLATIDPELASEWHPTKNGQILPTNVLSGSAKKVWWKCKFGHEWEATIVSRSLGRGCPICAKRIKTSFPEQAIFYYIKKICPDTISRDCSVLEDKMELDIYIPSLSIGIEYDGAYWHTEETYEKEQKKYCICKNKSIRLIRVRENNDVSDKRIADKIFYITKGPNYSQVDNVIHDIILYLRLPCNISIDSNCDEKEIMALYYSALPNNSLLLVNPELAKEWHPTRNGDLTPDMFSVSSGVKVWWLGKCGHEWEATVANRNMGNGCPYCSGQYRLEGENDLESVNPQLAFEWHPVKNYGLTPNMVGPNSNKKVWWLGKCGHEWEATVANRLRGDGCPFCTNHRVLSGFNDLATIDPELAKEWHPTKNGDLKPSMVTAKSGKKVWWLGKCGHEWEAIVEQRFFGRGCPYCSNKKILAGYNDLASVNPQLASEWHPTKNGDLKPFMVAPKSGKKVWWLGKCGHEWEAKIYHRANGSGCPICYKSNDKNI